MTDGIKIVVDATDAEKARIELEKLSTSVEKLETKTKKSTSTVNDIQKEIASLSSVSKTTTKAVDEVTNSLNNAAKELKSTATATQKTEQATTNLGESEEQAAARIKKMVAAAVERKKAADEAAEASRKMSRTLSDENKNWQEAVKAQSQSMSAYHKAEQAIQAQAAAEAKAKEVAQQAAAENEKKRAALTKLLGAIDKTEKALSVLDTQELELTNHFKAGRISVEAYNNALAKIQTQRNALTTVKNEAKNTTLEVNKLSKAVKVLSGLAITGFAGYGVVSFGKSIVESSMQWDKAKTIMENATGSADKAANELNFVKDISKKLNIELLGAATSYSKLVAVAKDSPELGKEVRGMFEGVSEAAAVLKLAPHEVNSILVNFEQMLSKGKVDLTDLKQIANLIPGTMEMAAKGLGKSTKEMSELISKGLVPSSEFLPRFADQLHTSFGGSAQQAAQGLQGQLTNLTNAWTDLKLEAGNAGFIDTFTDAVKGLTDILKDPAVKDGLNLLIQGMSGAAKYAAKGASGVTNVAKFVGEEVASRVSGVTSDDGGRLIEAEQQSAEKLKRAKENLEKAIKDGNQPEYWIKELEGQLKYAQKLYEDAKKALEESSERNGKAITADKQKAAEILNEDPLVAKYKETKKNLAEIQQKIAEQLKNNNGNVDRALIEQKDIYQKNLDETVKEVQEKYDSLLASQSEQSAKLADLQAQYAKAAGNLTAEQQQAILSQVEKLKESLSLLDQEVAKFKPITAITVRPAFKVEEKPKTGRTAKTDAQRQYESNERWIVDQEKQNATMNLGKVATLEYEIAQRKLTGALLERANALKQLAIEEQKRENEKTNQSLRIELLRANGQDNQADLLEKEFKLKETMQGFIKQGNIEGAALAKALFDTDIYKTQVDKIKGEIDELFDYQARQERAIQTQVQVGLITQYQGQKKLAALHKETADAVEKYLPELEKAATMPGEMGKQSKAYLTEINTQLLILKETSNELENAFRNGLQDGIQSSIDGLVKGTMNLQEALKNFVDSIASNILNVITQNIAQQATDGIMGGLNSLNSMFGFGGDTAAVGIDETSPQAVAISTASQEGAMAMQMGIEQGAMTAAQTISSAFSSMGAMNGGLGGDGGLFGNVTQQASEAVGAINTVKATKTAADASLTASAVSSAATTQATTQAAAASATASWTPAATAASVASFGSAAMIGLSALMMVLTSMKAFATGGHVRGDGTGTSDSIPAMLSNGEFVTRAKVVKQPGMLDFMKDLNNRGWGAVNDLTRVHHSTGGLAGVPAPSAPSLPSINLAPMENTNSTTVQNSIRLVTVKDENEFSKLINTHSGTRDSLKTFFIEENGFIKQILQS